MGFMRHDAIVVTSWIEASIQAAWEKAKELKLPVTSVTMSVYNGYGSFLAFLVCPDGSKEGWGPSVDMDKARDALVAWFDTQLYEDKSGPIDWIEVSFGGDLPQAAHIVRRKKGHEEP